MTTEDFKRKLAAILIADVEGYMSRPTLFSQLNPNLKSQCEWENQMRWAFY